MDQKKEMQERLKRVKLIGKSNHMNTLELFETLREPYASQAIANAVRDNVGSIDVTFESECDDLKQVLIRSFDWSQTQEGNLYWEEVYNQPDKYLKDTTKESDSTPK